MNAVSTPGPLAPAVAPLSAPVWLVRGAAVWASLLVLGLFTSTALVNLASLGLCLWAVAAWWHQAPWHLLREPLAVVLLGLLAWMLVREAWATASLARTLWVVVEFRVLVFALLWAPLFTWALPRRWAGGALMGGCALAAAGALAYLAITGQAVSNQAYRLAPNIGGQLMVMGLLGWALWALTSLQKVPARKALAFGALLVAAICVASLLFASYRRTGWVVLLAGAGAFVLAQAPVLSRRQLVATASAMLLALGVAAASPVVQQRVQMIATDLQTYQAADAQQQGKLELSSAIRVRMWQISLTLWAERPVTGTSFGAFAAEYKRIDNARGGSLVEGFNPHGEFVQMAAMFGAVGLLLYLGIYAALLQRAWLWRGTVQGSLVLVCTASLASSVLMNSMLIDMMEGHLFALVLAALAFARWPTPAAAPAPAALGHT